MSAQVIIKKYTGKDSDFGTVVRSLGIKRIDTCVPSVYSSERLGGKTIPADDASEARMYCIYRPEQEDCWAYSMECVFKLHLLVAPDVQLSNIRIYPVGPRPENVEDGTRLMIGNSISYSKPTNAKSTVAVHNIWDYSKEHPFYLSVAGLYGQVVDPAVSKYEYSVEYRDCGYGNMVYLDGERQPAVRVAVRSDAGDITVKFKDRTFLADSSEKHQLLQFVEPTNFTPIPEKYYRTVTPTDTSGDGPVMELLVKHTGSTADTTWNLMDLYPNGLIYKIPADTEYDYEGSGYVVYWVNLYAEEAGWHSVDDVTRDTDTSYVPNRWFKEIYDATDATVTEEEAERPFDKPVEYMDVEAKADENGNVVYYINGARRPSLMLDIHRNYHFFNRSGDKFPLRFIGNMNAPIANNIDDVITDGVVVIHGGSDIEELFVNPENVLKSGHRIGGYQCVNHVGLGNVVYNAPLCMCGNYNLCRVGGGIYNPSLAGETDYVYMQLQVSGKSAPGLSVPELKIEYDET